MSFQKVSTPLLIVCILILFNPEIGQTGNPADIEFFQERVEIQVSESDMGGYDVHVRGYYYFRNRTQISAERILFYPFPDYEGASFPREIRIVRYSDLEDGETVPAQTIENGITFAVGIAPASTTLIQVDYTQHTVIGRGAYINSVASAWNTPLELAEFVVCLPTSLCLTEISYPVDRVSKYDERITVGSRVHDFTPEEDLILRWKSEQEIRTAIP